MEIYLSEEEQWQKIKEWWKKYGNMILLGFIICMACTFGWRYWHAYKNKNTEQASLLYSQLVSLDVTHKTTDMQLIANHLIKDYGSSPYASLAALMLARDAVNANKLSSALQQLQWVVANSDSNSMRQIARVRAARILVVMKQPQKALQLLDTVDDPAYAAVVKEAKGDVYFSMGQNKEALASYEAAKNATAENAVTNALLQIKIAQLQGAK